MRFYKPMLAKSVPNPFSGKDWIFEAKWNNFNTVSHVIDLFFAQQK
jgi:hypothetical protein